MKRVNELVKRELSSLIRQHLAVDDYGVISVTEVAVSKDLKSASVYISTIGVNQKPLEILESLEKIRPALQYELSRRVIMKYTPHLAFKSDQGLERGQHILDLLESLEKDKSLE